MSKKIKFKKKLKKNFKILYAGNLGEAQNFEKIVEVAKNFLKKNYI